MVKALVGIESEKAESFPQAFRAPRDQAGNLLESGFLFKHSFTANSRCITPTL
jgi:hypothetical protein